MKYEPLLTLVEIRNHKGMTQKELAKASGINLGTIQALEQGINNPNKAQLATLLAICKALKIKLIHLFPNEKNIA